MLRQKAKRLTLRQIKSDKIQGLIEGMLATLKDCGVGLAAPQIGESLRLAVIEIKPLPHRPQVKAFPQTVIINPRIIKYSKKIVTGWEGCLSCSEPGTNRALIWGQVPRYERVTVEYLDEQGRPHREIHTGFTAIVFQHEIDHLNGLIFPDRMKDMKTLSVMNELKKNRK